LAVGSARVRPGADVPEYQGATGLGEIGGADVAHHPTALDALGVEPKNGPDERADHRCLLVFRQEPHVGKAGGVIHRHMHDVVADGIGADLLPVAVQLMDQLAEPGQGCDVDEARIAGALPFVTRDRTLWHQIS